MGIVKKKEHGKEFWKKPESESSHNSALLDSVRLRGCCIKSVFYERDGEMPLWGSLMVTDVSPAEFFPSSLHPSVHHLNVL